MNVDREEAELDWATIQALSWFFSGAAERDAGVRSVQGGFEATMHRLALCGPAGRGHAALVNGAEVWVDGDLPVHESRSTSSASDDAIERLHRRREQLAECRRVLARLDGLVRRHRAVLELQFGDGLWLCEDKVWPSQVAVEDRRWGVSLAMLCCTSLIVRATERANERRAKRKRAPVDARDAVRELLLATDARSRELVAQMVDEAGDAVSVAMGAYSRGAGQRMEEPNAHGS